jgi:hypothetical protein
MVARHARPQNARRQMGRHGMTITDPRPCERKCAECGEWKHHSRFRHWKRRYGTVSTFALQCKACEQKLRNEKKNADRPKAIIEGRARAAASKYGKSFQFFWIEMNYRSLVLPLRALMAEGSLCQACGHEFINERDIQIEHCEPPRHADDTARLHARNLRLACGSCNGTKGAKSFAQWLDEQEDARRSHLTENKQQPELQMRQMSIFDFGFER